MLKDKKAIIFDMDGTLIDSVGIWNDVDLALIKKLKGPDMKQEEVLKLRDTLLREFSAEANPYLCYCNRIKEMCHSGLAAEEVHALRYEIASQYLTDVIDYKPDADMAIKALKEKGFLLVIATTTKKTNMDIYRKKNKNISDKAPLDDYFSLIYTREDVTEIKPNPEVYLKTLEALKLKPQECIIFEDSLIGIESAKRAGIEAVAIYDKHSAADWDEIVKLSDYQLRSYKELLQKFL